MPQRTHFHSHCHCVVEAGETHRIRVNGLPILLHLVLRQRGGNSLPHELAVVEIIQALGQIHQGQRDIITAVFHADRINVREAAVVLREGKDAALVHIGQHRDSVVVDGIRKGS